MRFLLLTFFALSLAAAAQSPSPSLAPYTSCSIPGGPSIVETAPLAPGVNERTVQTRKGNATVSLAEGWRVMFAYPNEEFYANVKVEAIPAGTYAQSRTALLDNFDYLLTSGDNARNYQLKPILNGFAIQGLDRLHQQGGVLGLYLLLDDATHTAVTIYFLNQEHPHFKSVQEYATLRDHFLDTYTTCVRSKQ